MCLAVLGSILPAAENGKNRNNIRKFRSSVNLKTSCKHTNSTISGVKNTSVHIVSHEITTQLCDVEVITVCFPDDESEVCRV